MRHLTKASIVVTFATALAACTTAGSAVVNTKADQGLVLFDGGQFENVTPKRVTFVDTWQEEEYVRYDGDGTRAELIYAVADERDSIVLDVKLTASRSIETWHANANGSVALGEKGNVKAPLGDFQYQLYTLNGSQSCVGFLTEWDQRAGDPQLRPAKALFGYYCDKPGTTLNKDRVAGVLSDLWIEGIRRTDYRFTPRLSLASAGGSTETGNIGFPYAMADRFVDADGDRSSN